jgi:hypothetical protein
LRADAPLFQSVDELQWRGPQAEFAKLAAEIGDTRLLQRAHSASAALA